FDFRQIYYDSSVIDFDRSNVMQHFLLGENIGVTFNRQVEVNRDFYDIYSTIDLFTLHSLSLKESNSIAPLYLYPEAEKQQSLGESNERKPNLDAEIVKTIAQGLGLVFVPEKDMDSRLHGNDGTEDTFAPIDLLDYIYAVLHSPSYRETYKEFLKIDFPRIPYPKDATKFWALVKLGGELRGMHLLESPSVEHYITSYPHDGDNVITRKISKKDAETYLDDNKEGSKGLKIRVSINDEQCFEDIPLLAWEFYIGGYQPAQKWLKDRRGRKLSFDDIMHYQKIIVALTETHRIMQGIDEVGV
ncbi:MAG: type ISP restriction/modification enzyme, partial [Mariprofundaceae bacterium]